MNTLTGADLRIIKNILNKEENRLHDEEKLVTYKKIHAISQKITALMCHEYNRDVKIYKPRNIKHILRDFGDPLLLQEIDFEYNRSIKTFKIKSLGDILNEEDN